jgi:hypothetical protein
MKKCVRQEVLTNLRSIYNYLNTPLPPSYELFVNQNCNEDFVNLAANPRFQNYIDNLDICHDRYLEFKRIYHRLLIDIYRNSDVH